MSTEAKVARLPVCDFCDQTAHYDAKTAVGPWAHLCEQHFQTCAMYPLALGTGRGQRLVLAEPRKT